MFPILPRFLMHFLCMFLSSCCLLLLTSSYWVFKIYIDPLLFIVSFHSLICFLPHTIHNFPFWYFIMFAKQTHNLQQTQCSKRPKQHTHLLSAMFHFTEISS